MNRTIVGGLASFALVAAASGAAAAAPSTSVSDPGETRAASSRPDDLPNPLSDKQRATRRTAVGQVIKGKATVQERNGSSVTEVGGDYVELRRKSTDKIFTMLAEFGDEMTEWGGTPGPLHNEIAEPDRSVNNSTMWQPDYSADHYRDMLFSDAPGANSLTNYYTKQSSGRYSVTGSVTDWVKVPHNAAYYGSNDRPDSATWELIEHAADAWDETTEDLTQYDVWDRYDYDGDGNFNEADGYIDHFQIVHAGQGEEEGGGAQGSDAIWSHRWYAYYNNYGKTGPTFNPAGGVPIPGTDLWIGDYTVEPENGGVAVFAHEFGHDLGLPDHYDTSYKGENSSAFWGLMSSGSWLGDDEIEGIGDKPNDMSAWDKLQLGWLNYVVATKNSTTIDLGPSEYNTKKAQGIVVPLPDKTKTLELPTAPDGKAYWSTMGDDINTAMTLKTPVALPSGSTPTLDFSTWYDIEAGYDYVYVEASTDGGTTWERLSNALTGNDAGIDGSSGGSWVNTSFSLTPYAGESVLLRLNYITDGGVALKGLLADNIKVNNGASVLFDDGVGDGANWNLTGFQVTTGTQTSSHPTYYIAENKGYRSYNSTLQSGPYNFGFLRTKPDWVEHFPYQEGLLISYWDESQMDNNVGEHPGEGLILPIDAHPQPMRWKDRSMMRTRIQVYDATFDVPGRTDQVTLSKNGVPTTFGGLPEVSRFSDSDTYWYAGKPDAGVKLQDTGTAITVNSESGNVMNVTVTKR